MLCRIGIAQKTLKWLLRKSKMGSSCFSIRIPKSSSLVLIIRSFSVRNINRCGLQHYNNIEASVLVVTTLPLKRCLNKMLKWELSYRWTCWKVKRKVRDPGEIVSQLAWLKHQIQERHHRCGRQIQMLMAQRWLVKLIRWKARLMTQESYRTLLSYKRQMKQSILYLY